MNNKNNNNVNLFYTICCTSDSAISFNNHCLMDNESLCRINNHKILNFIVATKGCIWDVQLPSWQAAFYAKDDKNNLAKLNLQGKRLHHNLCCSLETWSFANRALKINLMVLNNKIYFFNNWKIATNDTIKLLMSQLDIN